MANIHLTINEKIYKITCKEGQEGHLIDLAEHLDKKIKQNLPTNIDQTHTLLLLSLLLMDENQSYKRNAVKQQPSKQGALSLDKNIATEKDVEIIDSAVDYIETLVDFLKKY